MSSGGLPSEGTEETGPVMEIVPKRTVVYRKLVSTLKYK